MSFTTGLLLKPRSANITKFKQSECDETLFGERRKSREPDAVPEFEPPWVDNGKTKLKPAPKPLLFYCPTTPSRSPSRQTTPSPSVPTSRGRYKPVKFSPTYVDETLFGKKPVQPNFEPPWVKESDKKFVRPILFDYSGTLAFNSTINDERCSSRRSSSSRASERPSSVSGSRKSGTSTPVKRAWR